MTKIVASKNDELEHAEMQHLLIKRSTNLLLEELFAKSPLANKTPIFNYTKETDSKLFVKGPNITHRDSFSASWWQRTERFLDFDARKEIHTVEDDAFAAIKTAGRGHKDACMTKDLLDFSVEHLSKWWKDTGHDSLPYLETKLTSYTGRIRSQPPQDNVFNSTLAVIPYGVTDDADNYTRQFWTAALFGTMTSILTHQVARIVVVGHYEADETLARQVFEQLSGLEVPPTSPSMRSFEILIGSSQVAFVHTDNVNSTYIRQNVPKGALVDLQDALAGKSDEPNPFLGASNTAERFKYVFMTEADQLLTARVSSDFFTAMDNGSIIIPHRLQAMPHPQDLESFSRSTKLKSLPGHKQVIALDTTKDSCCDTGEHQLYYTKVCDAFWFRCGYGEYNSTFRHLDEYDFVSLSQGSGLVTLAGNQHSRRCTPKRNGIGTCY